MTVIGRRSVLGRCVVVSSSEQRADIALARMKAGATMIVSDDPKSERRQGVLVAAIRLFDERGFENVSYEEIAQAAFVSRPTVFNYFPFKEAFVIEHVAQQTAPLLAAAQQDLDQGRLPLDVLRALLGRVSDYLQENPHLLRPLMTGIKRPPASEEWRSAHWNLDQTIADIVAKGQTSGSIRLEHPPRLVSFLVMAILEATALAWLDKGTGRPLAQEMLGNVQMLFSGVGAKPRAAPALREAGRPMDGRGGNLSVRAVDEPLSRALSRQRWSILRILGLGG